MQKSGLPALPVCIEHLLCCVSQHNVSAWPRSEKCELIINNNTMQSNVNSHQMCIDITKRPFGHVCPAKMQISQCFGAVWSEPSLGAFWIANDAVSLCGQQRLIKLDGQAGWSYSILVAYRKVCFSLCGTFFFRPNIAYIILPSSVVYWKSTQFQVNGMIIQNLFLKLNDISMLILAQYVLQDLCPKEKWIGPGSSWCNNLQLLRIFIYYDVIAFTHILLYF